jgi:hypothetical protein
MVKLVREVLQHLAAWRRRVANISHDHLRHPAVKRAKFQEWRHVPGDEFSAATLVLVPALPAILCVSFEEDPNFNVQDNHFVLEGLISSRRRSDSRDPFLALPNDIITILLEFLGSREVASLRLSSRAFRNLPISLFTTSSSRKCPGSGKPGTTPHHRCRLHTHPPRSRV